MILKRHLPSSRVSAPGRGITILMILFMTVVNLAAGGWYQKASISTGENINKLFCRDFMSRQIFAVGDNGWLQYSRDGGESWIHTSPPTSNNLYSIFVYNGSPDTVIIAVGDFGTVLRSIDMGVTWTTQNLTSSRLTSITFDGSMFWIGGYFNQEIYHSSDLGLTWQPAGLERGTMNVTAIIPTNYGIYATAQQDTNAYILQYFAGPDTFMVQEIFPNTRLNAGLVEFGRMHLAGVHTLSGQGVVVIKNDGGGFWGPGLFNMLPTVNSEIMDINGLFDYSEKLWISTLDGHIYESPSSALNFRPGYQNFESRHIRSIAVRPVGAPEAVAWAAGSGGLFLKYDFSLLYVQPSPNGYAFPAQNNVQLKFSARTDLASVNQGTYIFSSIKGKLNFLANYMPGDSTVINLQLFQGTVPGETYTIILSNRIHEQDLLSHTLRDFSFESWGASNTSLNPVYTPGLADTSIDLPSTNFVTAFFNSDALFDLAFFAKDTLYCFAGQAGGGFAPAQKIAFGPLVQIQGSLTGALQNQLKVMDLNRDGRPDLVLFDRNVMHFLINNSSVSFNFTPMNAHNNSNIIEVTPFAADNDSTLDLAIVSDSLQTRINADETNPGNAIFTEGNINWYRFTVGDIDADGIPDFAAIRNSGEIVVRHRINTGLFDIQYTIPGSFEEIALAEMNQDKQLEILARSGDVINIYTLNGMWNFSLITTIVQGSPASVHSFKSFDFDGDQMRDIFISTDNQEIKIFKNNGSWNFTELPGNMLKPGIDPLGILNGDFNQDGVVDLITYDIKNGYFQTFYKSSSAGWRPQLNPAQIVNNSVHLSWTPFPQQNALSFYRVYRDTIPGVPTLLADTDTNYYIDNTVLLGQTYFYSVEAYDTLNQPSPRSDDLVIQVFPLLEGSLSGVLSQTNVPYVVTQNIQVDADSVLLINPGVRMQFKAGTGFDIYGRLTIMGGPNDMVSLEAINQDSSWNGMTISGNFNTDTVRIFWCTFSGADSALKVSNRPLRMQYGSIEKNRIGLVSVSGAAVNITNFVMADNEYGVLTRTGVSRTALKNVTIVNNRQGGILAAGDASVTLKNSIVWGNNFQTFKGADINSTSSQPLSIYYSTVDSIQGNILSQRIQRIPPLFQQIMPDSLPYRPDFMSATIDAGDPLDDFQLEPMPNGARINQGAFGGTPFATQSYQPGLEVSPDTLFFLAAPGQSDTVLLRLSNTGTTDLQIFNLGLHVAEFNYFMTFPIVIPAGGSILVPLYFSPNSPLTFTDKMMITSNDPHSPYPGFPLSLIGRTENSPPVIATFKLNNAIQNMAYIDTVRAYDLDGGTLTFSALTVPNWMAVQSDGALSGTPGVNDVGMSFPVFIRVLDDHNLADTLFTAIDVLESNSSPQILTLSLKNASENIPYADTVRAMDPDTDNLSFSALTVPPWMSITSGGILSGTPLQQHVGNTIPVMVRVGDGNGAYDTLSTTIDVLNVNDPPQFLGIPDTLIYAFVPFTFIIQGFDPDGDLMTYSDDSPLFDVDLQSGLINFTPTLADTGTHLVSIQIHDGITAVSKSFKMTILLPAIQTTQNVTLTPGDQILVVNWFNPQSPFYHGTRIFVNTSGPVGNPTSGGTYYETTATPNSDASYTLSGLEIGQVYFVTLFNYFDPGTRIYSEPLWKADSTLSPAVRFDLSDHHFYVPPEDTIDTFLTIMNQGGGTLNFHFQYPDDAFVQTWFELDTTVHTIAPGDSGQVSVKLHPHKSMGEIDHIITTRLLANQPGWITQDTKLIMHILFDHQQPTLTMISEPDTLHFYSALRFQFTATDTQQVQGWTLGDPKSKLLARYKFLDLTNAQIIKEETGIPLGTLDFYPVEDGLYQLKLWIYDTEGNGAADNQVALHKSVLVSASTAVITPLHWHLTSIPREQDIDLNIVLGDTTFNIYRWSNQENRYLPYQNSILKAGEGYWLLSTTLKKFDVKSVPVISNQDSVHVAVEKGWNQIGIPAGYPLEFKSLQFRPQIADTPIPILDAVEQDRVLPAVYWYNSISRSAGYEWGLLDTTYAIPWRGYWLFANEPGELVFSRRPAFQAQKHDIPLNPGATSMARLTAENWKLYLAVQNETHRDGTNIIGIQTGITDFLVYEPPYLDEYCSAFFVSAKGKLTCELKQPFRDFHEIKEWQLQIESSSTGKVHELQWRRWSEESGVYVYLLDQQGEQVISMSEQENYQFKMNDKSRSFSIFATQDPEFSPKIVPLTCKLLQNYPNPFNPVTTIRFGIPGNRDGQIVTLKIYNIIGQEIITLLQNKMTAGYHEVIWNSNDEQGRRLASGLYFFCLSTGEFMETRKMVLLR